MSKLLYLPLEGYVSRYTLQWSAPKTGWLERNWLKYGLPYKRIEPDGYDLHGPIGRTIKTGSVLDAVGRSLFTMAQIGELLRRAENGEVSDEDVIFMDDFWTPGFEALPYAFHLLGIRPRMYAFLHAQSVDEFDFTRPMLRWMRHFEIGIGKVLDGIFTSCPTLKELIVRGGIAHEYKVHVTGHPFCSEEVMERMPRYYQAFMGNQGAVNYQRKNQIVWSSRWDWEKDPEFFLAVVDRVLGNYGAPKDTKFVLCTSAKELRSNKLNLLAAANQAQNRYGKDKFEIKEGLSKEEYYAILCESKVQFNSALQDFVPITLQEASVAGCWPVYPYFRAMPESLMWDFRFLYVHKDVEDAAGRIRYAITRNDLWTPEEIRKRAWIHERFDTSWYRMAKIMGFRNHLCDSMSVPDSIMEAARQDPFARPDAPRSFA